jgi:outer membrane lipoprotein-sorting protein
MDGRGSRRAFRRFLAMAFVITAAWGLFAGNPAKGASSPPDVDKVLDRLDDLYRSKASIGRMDLIVTRPGLKRSLAMRVWSKGEDRALIVIDSPAREAGTATLRVKKNLWNYLPRIARTLRIPPSMMLGSWMGSDFTNDDLVQESSLRKDFTARLDGRSEEPKGWRIRLEAKPGVVGLWKRIELVVSEENGLPVQEKSYDRRERLSRVMTYDEVRELGGRRIPTHITVTPADQTGHQTELHYSEMKFDADVPDSVFSLSQLEKAR